MEGQGRGWPAPGRRWSAGCLDATSPVWRLGGVDFGLSTTGAFPYRCVLANRQMVWKIARAMQPSVQVELSSEGLWHRGADALHDQVQAIASAEKMGAVASNAVSRVNYAFDYHMPYRDFSINNMVSRAR
ncbi:MAG: hypothetical protein AAFY83_08425 [Pseudomonadota bacterium]